MRPVLDQVCALGLEPARSLEVILLGNRPQRLRNPHRRPRDDLGVPRVGLRVAGGERRGPVRGDAGKVCDLDARGTGAPDRQHADVPALVDDDQGSPQLGRVRDHPVYRGLGVVDARAEGVATVRQDGVGVVGPLADVESDVEVVGPLEAMHDVSSNQVGRPKARARTPTLPSRLVRQVPISPRRAPRRPPLATPPGPSERQGRTAMRGRPVGGPMLGLRER